MKALCEINNLNEGMASRTRKSSSLVCKSSTFVDIRVCTNDMSQSDLDAVGTIVHYMCLNSYCSEQSYLTVFVIQ